MDQHVEQTYCKSITFYIFLADPGKARLLYKHLRHPLVKISLRRRHAPTVKNGASSHNTKYINIFLEILNLEGHHNCCIGSKVTVILLNRLIYWWSCIG